MTLLRCLMGFSVGGEYTGVVAYLIEGAAPHRRGLVTSLASSASEVGGLLPRRFRRSPSARSPSPIWIAGAGAYRS